MLLDQQPVVALLASPAVHTHQMPSAVQLLSFERERQMPFRQALVRIVLRVPASAVPDHYRAAAILALRDRAFELVVLGGVVFHLHGEPLLPRHKARAARYRPALHPAVELKPQVIMQPSGSVFLDDIGVAAFALHLALRFGGHVKTTFGAIAFQSGFNAAWHDLDRGISRRRAPDRLSDGCSAVPH